MRKRIFPIPKFVYTATFAVFLFSCSAAPLKNGSEIRLVNGVTVVYDHRGREAFLHAMTHPKDLLSVYREIAAGDPSLPRISKETADAWAAL